MTDADTRPGTSADATPPAALRIDLAAMRRHTEDQRHIEVALSPAWLRSVLADTDAEVPGPAALTLTVLLQPKGIVVVHGRLSLALFVPCGRCLAPATVDGSADLVATYLPAATAQRRVEVAGASGEDDEEGISLHEEDLDTWTYEGTTLELFPVVAEYVKLAYPMRALCERGETCRGLCSNCGAVLNETPPTVLVCPQCHAAVPVTPVADLPPAGANPVGPAEPEKLPSLAAALKKAGFDPPS